MKLASNSVIVPVQAAAGTSGISVVLLCSTTVDTTASGGGLPTVTSANAGISITVDQAAGLQTVTYAAPGDSYPSDFQMLTLSIDIGSDVIPGLYGINVANAGNTGTNMPPAIVGPAFLSVVAK